MPNKFPMGDLVSTPGAMASFEGTFMQACLARHLQGDWGNLDRHDTRENERALKTGERILSAYEQGDKKLWIITEADRSVTTFLLPSEY